MRKPIYVHFTHILQKEKWCIKSFCYNIVENHFYARFDKIKKSRKLKCIGDKKNKKGHIYINKIILMSSTKDIG